MFKDIEQVFYPVFYHFEKIPIIILTIVILLIIIITILIVKKELKKIC